MAGQFEIVSGNVLGKGKGIIKQEKNDATLYIYTKGINNYCKGVCGHCRSHLF